MRQENRPFEAAMAQQRNVSDSRPSESEGPGRLDPVEVAWNTPDGKYGRFKHKRDCNSKSKEMAKPTSHYA
jgi:hypothetical protein